MSLLSTVRRSAFTKGVFGGSRPWLLLGLAAWTLRGLQWALRPSPKAVYKGRLQVGQALTIEHLPAPPTRRQRRKQRRRDRRAARAESRRTTGA